MQKKVMMLGGNYFQMTAVLAAKRLGYHVIDVDYLPDNPAHKFADEYYNISTLDKEKVLEKARELKIDGIVSYASDVSAPTAAYVAEQLGLPTNPYESVMIMTHKDSFRRFLTENGFPVPRGRSFTDPAEAKAFAESLGRDYVVKPIDSSGSKGVCMVRVGGTAEASSACADPVSGNPSEEDSAVNAKPASASDGKSVANLTGPHAFETAWEEAYNYSISKTILVEEFIHRNGYQIDGDAYVVDGKIRFWGICDQHHDLDCSPYAPIGHSFPPVQPLKYQEMAKQQIQRVFDLLHMHMGAYNIEYIIGDDDQVYLLEIGPRNGGNLITDAIAAATGVDLAEYTVRQACGDSCEDLVQTEAHTPASSYIIHAQRDGIFRGIEIDPVLDGRIVKQAVFVEPGDRVTKFRNGSFGIGAMVITFDSTEQMCEMIDHMSDYVRVLVDD